ncbi:MAG: gamma-glutamyl-gamma-aminobutyrate hydrolase family protein [Bacillota bacterium]|nr:gamma-glutamyl-gamma-aminobutyrate hydrolase family protein [Clostridia bacterium]
MIPIIGITCGEDELNFFVRQFYVQAVEGLGGVPLLLPALKRNMIREKYLELLDGLILSGGVDVNPVLFGEEPVPGLGEITPQRDEFELLLTREFFSLGKPIFAVCRGCQVLNLALGGTVYQDINSQLDKIIKHDQKAPRACPTHSLKVQPGTKLSRILPQEYRWVNSFHHQAVKDPAPGFIVAALASDGVIEAIEAQDHPFALGVQWHPECNWREDLGSYRLFQEFIKACQGTVL